MVAFTVDGVPVSVEDDDGVSLLEVLRDRLGIRTPKDGCSPQGQCGCCTVLVDGQPRVSCVTPARRVAGRTVTTLDGLADADEWAAAFTAHGASQCGFCTPGIIMRLAALRVVTPSTVEGALVAHLCRCTGWRTIVDAALGRGVGERDFSAAALRATIEGGSPQTVGDAVARGGGGFADDSAPLDALVAVPDGRGDYAVGSTLSEARARAGKVQGRRSTSAIRWPVALPPGSFDLTLRTTWVEPAYLEPDAAWCAPGGTPVGPLANGGAFGGKVESPVALAARRLADSYGRPVRVLYAREDVVRLGPKRPPMAAGVRASGEGVMRVARTPGLVVPGFTVEHVDVAGPPTSAAVRGAGWVEAAVLRAAVTGSTRVVSPQGSWASASVSASGLLGGIEVEVAAGPVLDETVLRSYCIGAAHQALGWVTSEAIAVDDDGVPTDLTIRSFGILRARDMPPVSVSVVAGGSEHPVNGSDAVLAAVAAAVWRSKGYPPEWPTDRRSNQ